MGKRCKRFDDPMAAALGEYLNRFRFVICELLSKMVLIYRLL